MSVDLALSRLPSPSTIFIKLFILNRTFANKLKNINYIKIGHGFKSYKNFTALLLVVILSLT